MNLHPAYLALAALAVSSACAPQHPFKASPSFAEEAVRSYVDRGAEAIPELRSLLEHDSVSVRAHARTALSRITGQWGADGTGLTWKTSVDQAVQERALGDDRPLMVLHLFGKLDEEFC